MEKATLVAAEGCGDPPPGSVTQRSVWRQRPARLQRGARLHRTVRLHDCCSFEGEPRSGKMLVGEKPANRRNRTVTGVTAATRLAPTRHAPQIPCGSGRTADAPWKHSPGSKRAAGRGSRLSAPAPIGLGAAAGKAGRLGRAATHRHQSALQPACGRPRLRRGPLGAPPGGRSAPRRSPLGAEKQSPGGSPPGQGGSSIHRPAGSSARAPS